MALKIIWTLQAESGLDNVILYLQTEWTSKEILKLELNIKQVINQISIYPDLYPKSALYKNLRKALVDKNNYIIYKVNVDSGFIEIINFRSTKQTFKY